MPKHFHLACLVLRFASNAIRSSVSYLTHQILHEMISAPSTFPQNFLKGYLSVNGASPIVMRCHMPGALDNFLNSECFWNAEGVLANVGYLVKTD